MSDYEDREYQERIELEREIRGLENRLNNLIDRLNNAIRENNILKADVQECQQDVSNANRFVGGLQNKFVPPFHTTGDQLNITGGKGNDCSSILTELNRSYDLLKNQSTATKTMTKLVNRYFSAYGSYSDIRNIALGYVVGVDSAIWNTETPRKTIEAAYLANTPYWLSSAMMATMLWASDEKEAAERAVKQALELDEKKATLYFMLVNLRFERIDAARLWYDKYFSMLDEGNITGELQYVIQAMLCGALGKDVEFEKKCFDKICELFDNARKRDPNLEKTIKSAVREYYAAFPHYTSKQYVMAGRCVKEYTDMLDVISAAEKNNVLLEHYKPIFESDKAKGTLAKKIEDTLSSLLNAHDESEDALFNEIKYYDFVIKAKGNEQIAKEAYNKDLQLRKQKSDIGRFLVNIAMTPDENMSLLVRKFALGIIGKYCKDATREFAEEYRKKEKKEYSLSFDGWNYVTDE